MIDLSIVLTTYNDFENFKITFESIINEISFDDEIIIIDSSSNDFAKKYSSSYKNVKYFFQSPKGVFPAMNFGISLCSNQYIQIMCSGDTIIENTLNAVKESISFNKNNFKLFVFSQVYKFDNDTSYSIHPSMNTLFPHQSVICHHTIYEKALYPEKYFLAADQIFFAEIRKEYDVYFEKIKFTSYDMHGLSRKVSLKNSKDIFLIYKKLDRRYIVAFFYAYILPFSRFFIEILFGKKLSFKIGFYFKKLFISEFDY